LVVGDAAPGFALPKVRGGELELAKVLSETRAALVFYRGGWCPICNRQLADISNRYADFRACNVAVLAISNEEVRQGKKVLAKVGPPYPLLLDSSSNVIARYGLVAAKRDPLGWVLRKHEYAHPAVVLIGQDSRIEWFYRGKNYRDRPTVDQILAAVRRTEKESEPDEGDQQR